MSARSERDTLVTIPGWVGFALIGVFIALKLAGVTDWSWWWVLSPLWIGAALGLLALGALLLSVALLALYARIQLRFRLKRAFPEIYIDTSAWSRSAVDHSDTASSLRVTHQDQNSAEYLTGWSRSNIQRYPFPGMATPRATRSSSDLKRRPLPRTMSPAFRQPTSPAAAATPRDGSRCPESQRYPSLPPKGIGHGDQVLVVRKPVPSQARLTTGHPTACRSRALPDKPSKRPGVQQSRG